MVEDSVYENRVWGGFWLGSFERGGVRYRLCVVCFSSVWRMSLKEVGG